MQRLYSQTISVKRTAKKNQSSDSLSGRRSVSPHSLKTPRGSLSSPNAQNFACLKLPSGVHSVNSICPTSSGLSQTQFFISSRVSAHCVRFFSGRLAKGQVLLCMCFNFAQTSRASPSLWELRHSDRGWADSHCCLGWPFYSKVVAALGAVSGEVTAIYIE